MHKNQTVNIYGTLNTLAGINAEKVLAHIIRAYLKQNKNPQGGKIDALGGLEYFKKDTNLQVDGDYRFVLLYSS